MFKRNKIDELEDRIAELSKTCKKHNEQLKTHEEMLIHAAKILRAMDKTMGPVYAHYVEEVGKKRQEPKNMYG